MEVFYLKKDEFLNAIEMKSLEEFSDGRAYSSEVKYEEHLCGLFLTKFVAKNIYGLKNTDIVLKGAKPIFATSKMQFSISHSNDIVLVAFNKSNIGADVEYMRQRDYKDILSRYVEVSNEPTKEEFYRFWTDYEAKIKLDQDPVASFSTVLEDNYMLTCLSDDVLVWDFSVKQLVVTGEKVDLVKSFQGINERNLRLVTREN